VIMTCGPDDDAEKLQCERFGLDDPPPNATVLLVIPECHRLNR
jgi:hypothetical protein